MKVLSPTSASVAGLLLLCAGSQLVAAQDASSINNNAAVSLLIHQILGTLSPAADMVPHLGSIHNPTVGLRAIWRLVSDFGNPHSCERCS